MPNFIPHRKVPCQADVHTCCRENASVKVSEEEALARHGASGASRNGGATTAPLLERLPLGAATTVTPAWTGPWLRLDLGPVRHRECRFHRSSKPIVAISLDVPGARAAAVGLRVAPSRLVSPARCCCGSFWAATHLPPRSPSSMSLEELWGLGRLLSELTQLCDMAQVCTPESLQDPRYLGSFGYCGFLRAQDKSCAMRRVRRQ